MQAASGCIAPKVIITRIAGDNTPKRSRLIEPVLVDRLNQADLARNAAVSPTTAQRWLSILDASFLITLLQRLAESKAKRLIKVTYPAN